MSGATDGKDRPTGSSTPDGAKDAMSTPSSPIVARPSRRELITRVGAAAGVLAGSAVLGRAVWDRGGFGAATSSAVRQVRDYRLRDSAAPDFAELAIAKARAEEQAISAETLVRRAVDALGGTHRVISRGDVLPLPPHSVRGGNSTHAADPNRNVV